jgi:hypothetical protein
MGSKHAWRSGLSLGFWGALAGIIHRRNTCDRRFAASSLILDGDGYSGSCNISEFSCAIRAVF